MNNQTIRRIVYAAGIAVFCGHFLQANADTIAWQYKAPCNPYTVNQSNDVEPGYYYNVSGQCVYGDVNSLQSPTPHEYSDHGMVFYNGYNPTPPVPSYYSNQSFTSSNSNQGHQHGKH